MKFILSAIVFLIAAQVVHGNRNEWQIGLQCWTFKNKTLLETIDYCAANGIQYLEMYPGQRIGDGFEGKSGHSMSVDECVKLKAILSDKNIKILSYGVVRSKTEDEWRRSLEFANRMGIRNIIGEPPQKQMKMLDRLAAEYNVSVGIHNHREPTPDLVEELLDGLSQRIGIAPDTGHWARHGIDPVPSLERFKGRIVSMHLKDINQAKRDVPFGTGLISLGKILTHLDQSGYKGPIIIEYESNNQSEAVKECLDYMNRFIKTGIHPEP